MGGVRRSRSPWNAPLPIAQMFAQFPYMVLPWRPFGGVAREAELRGEDFPEG